MKRMTWLSLPLALLLGCHHHNLRPHHAAAFSADGPMRRFTNTRSQIHFVSPSSMKVGWEVGPKTFGPGQLTVPARYNFDQSSIYRLKLNDVPGRMGKPYYPTLEVAPSTPRTDPYLTHNAIPIEFTDEDFDQVDAGNFVTKVIYLPDPQHQELAIAGVETLVSTRLDPGVDPVAEADRRGTILAIVRLGGIDLEMPQMAPVHAAAAADPSGNPIVTVGPQQRGPAMVQYPMGGESASQPVFIQR